MMREKILIAADHGGVSLKETLKDAFSEQYEWIDLGTHGADSVDYPDFADKMAQAIADGVAVRGVLVCGTGIGISIAANRHNHIRCAVCTDVTMARLSRDHNHANVLALGARITGDAAAIDILDAFLTSEESASERHLRRVNKLTR